MKLSFYLFNDTVTDFNQVINKTKFEGQNSFERLKPRREVPFECEAYFQKNRPTPPKWLRYITEDFEVDEEEIFNQTNSFLLLIKVDDRIFAVTTGFGFNALNRDNLERGFGLRVVLNEIDPDKIKSIDSRNIDTTTKQKRVFLNRNSPLYDFDFDFEEDLLSLVTGIPNDLNLARKMVGADSLNLTSDIQLNAIGEKCSQLLVSFNKETYKTSFSFIDNLKIIKDATTLGHLDNQLLRAINERQEMGLMVAYPDIDNISQVEKYRIFSPTKADIDVEEVDLQSIYEFLNQNVFQDLKIKKIYIQGLNQDDQQVTEKFRLYDYLVYETDLDGKKYLFTLSKWFEIAKDFVDEVNDAINGIEEIVDNNFLPEILRGESEGDFNRQAAEEKGYLLLDKNNYPAGGNSKIEVCDLYTPDRQFICVKKYNGSSTLSHLFNQGLVSAECLAKDQNYRLFIVNKIPIDWLNKIEIENLDKSNIQFIFAIATQKDGRVTDSLPFFSKVSLRYARKEIENLGIKVLLYKIKFQNI